MGLFITGVGVFFYYQGQLQDAEVYKWTDPRAVFGAVLTLVSCGVGTATIILMGPAENSG